MKRSLCCLLAVLSGVSEAQVFTIEAVGPLVSAREAVLPEEPPLFNGLSSLFVFSLKAAGVEGALLPRQAVASGMPGPGPGPMVSPAAQSPAPSAASAPDWTVPSGPPPSDPYRPSYAPPPVGDYGPPSVMGDTGLGRQREGRGDLGW